jgi:hypothetical protein
MRFITVDEYLMDRAKLHDLPEELVENVQVTVQRANDLLAGSSDSLEKSIPGIEIMRLTSLQVVNPTQSTSRVRQ